MKAVVFAYHNMGVVGIRKLVEAGFEIPLVFTHTDSAAEHIWFGSVADLCRELAITCVTPETPNTPSWIERIGELEPAIIFSFYYRTMLPKEILALPPLGAYNLHGSYLPAYRGRCPVNWVIIKGEKQTGVTLHQMVEQPDAGPIVAQEKVAIASNDTALTLFNKLVRTAGTMLEDVLPKMKAGAISKTPQDLIRGSYYGGRKPEDGCIVWQRSAVEIGNLIRGVTRPYPGAFCFLDGEKLTIWSALVQEDTTFPTGQITVCDERVFVGTDKGSIQLTDVEIGGRVLTGNDLPGFFKQHGGDYLQ
jgi:methionyl-tRNA formyltransferase